MHIYPKLAYAGTHLVGIQFTVHNIYNRFLLQISIRDPFHCMKAFTRGRTRLSDTCAQGHSLTKKTVRAQFFIKIIAHVRDPK